MTAKETTLDAEHHVVAAMYDAKAIAEAAVGELHAAGFKDVRVTRGAPGADAAEAHAWDELEHSFGREDRDVYAEGVRRGATLVVVGCGARCDLAASILEKNLPVDLDERARAWGVRRVAVARPGRPVRLRVVRRARTLAEAIRAIDVLALDLEVDYRQRPARGVSFDRWRAVYEYGRELASADPRGWDAIEEGARGRFEQKNPGRWGVYRDVVRRGYERALARQLRAGEALTAR